MATNYLIRKTGSDSNGGTSRTVRSTGTDGIVNTTVGLTKITSITSAWSAGDIGHGIATSAGSKYSIITAFTAGTTVAVTTSNGSTNMTSAALFSAGMVGQAVTGPGIAANTVITVFVNSSSVTLSIAAGAGAGSGTATLYNMLTVGTNMTAGTGQTWTVGGAWLTIGQALVTTTTAITNGDKVYIGAGIYRQQLTIGITSPTAEVQIIGDVDGSVTGDPGEIIWTGYTAGDRTTSSGALLTMNGRDFLTFQNITFSNGSNIIILATTTTSTNITISNCTFLSGAVGANTVISITVAFGVTATWSIDSCRFLGGSAAVILVTLTTGSGSDYDAAIVIKNCLIVASNTQGVSVTSSGSSAQEGGGVLVRNCTLVGCNVGTSTTRVGGSTFTFPVKAENCFIYIPASTGLNSSESGNLTEDYNLIMAATARTNVTAGAHSISDGSYAPYYDIGQALANGFIPRPFLMPSVVSPMLGFGNASGAPVIDILGLNRPSGSILKSDTGTATAGGAKTLTNTGKTWGTNVWLGYVVKIISGTGSGQTKSITSNTSTVLTVDGNWKTQPDNTSVYEIYLGALSSSGTATAGSTTTLTDSNAAWGVNMWAGYTLKIDGGTGSGQSLIVVSNTATVITFATATAPDNTSTYKLYRGTDENTVNNSIGCYERGETAVQETSTVRSGSSAIRIAGPGVQDFELAVDVTLTNISVYTQFDAAYSGTKPSMSIINGTEAGVSNATATAVGSSGSWEQLSLSFTPTSAGLITVRLQSSTTTPTGNAFFDDFGVY